jgi:hypothetical protein
VSLWSGWEFIVTLLAFSTEEGKDEEGWPALSEADLEYALAESINLHRLLRFDYPAPLRTNPRFFLGQILSHPRTHEEIVIDAIGETLLGPIYRIKVGADRKLEIIDELVLEGHP